MTFQKEYFDAAARRYGPNAILVPGASHFRNAVLGKAMRKGLTPVLKRFHKIEILDLGCGVGRWMKIMAERNSVIGVDISRSMIGLAKNTCRDLDCSFVVADACFLPFKTDAFDAIVSITVLQHLLEEEKLLRALFEMVRCGRSQALIAEEMWSTKEILLPQTYCPIRILPLKAYVRSMIAVGFHPLQFRGITPAILAIELMRFLTSNLKLVEGNLTSRFKSSRLLSETVHFIMGVGTLSSVFMPAENYNPCFSLHTVLYAEKKDKG